MVTHIGFCSSVDLLMYKIELLVKVLPHFYIYGFSGNKHWLPHEDLLPTWSCPKWIELLQKASHTEDIPKASLMSDKIIPVPEGFLEDGFSVV